MTNDLALSNATIIRQSKDEMSASIVSFSQPLANFLEHLGLPVEQIFNPVSSRQDIIENLDAALRDIARDERSRAFYLSKFTVAVSVGLFDSALNYLWNETINGLRQKLSDFDLNYFYNIAGQFNSRYRNYSSNEDLNSVDDADLLEACRRIGIISDVNYNRLIHINYMRNHASAAHPNSQEISGFELLNWLTTCLTHVIGASFDHSVLYIKRFLNNYRQHEFPREDVNHITEELNRLTQNQADDLAWAIFGMYCDSRSSENVRKNTEVLARSLWSITSEDRRYQIGAKFGYYRKTGEVDKRESASKFLDLVDANRYKDEDSLAGELIEKLENLKRIHFQMGNFYNEHLPAKALRDSLPTNGIVPRSAKKLWVKVNILGYVGNGMGYRDGVDEMALPYYTQNIELFTDEEIAEAARLFTDMEFYTSLSRSKAESRARQLLDKLNNQTSNLEIKKVLGIAIAHPSGSLSSLHTSPNYKRALEKI